MLLFQAIVLGLLQGLTEFLPVSSSGHLTGIPYLLGWESGSLAFDVLVHAGTLVAVLAFFRGDLWFLITRALRIGDHPEEERQQAWRVIALLAVGTVPAAAAGLLFEEFFTSVFESPRTVAGLLYVTALLLVVAERLRTRRAAREVGKAVAHLDEHERLLDPGRREDTVTFRDALTIGGAQALAILPGISRSGSTIAAGMLLGLSRAAAARFSFLLSIPIIIGATASMIPDLGTPQPGTLPFEPIHTFAGVLAAAISGYWAIRFLLRLVKSDDLLGFARYVAGFATLLLAATFWIG